MTVLELMERVGSKNPNWCIAHIRDAFKEMGMVGEVEPKVHIQDIYDDRARYVMPSYVAKVLNVACLYEANKTELISTTADRDFSAASNWTNTDINSYSETNALTLTASVALQSCYLNVADIITIGHRYRLEYDCTLTSGTWKLYTYAGNLELGRFVNGTDQYMEFTASATDMLKIVATVAGTASFDNFSLKELGIDEYRLASRIVGEVENVWFDEAR